MQDGRFGALPVVLGERIIGVLELKELAGRSDAELATTPVTALMVRPEALTLAPATLAADDALKLLVQKRTGVLGLVSPAGELVGVFTSDSAMQWVAGVRPTGAEGAHNVLP